MELKVVDVIEQARKFTEQTGYTYFKVFEVTADEPKSRWIVIVDVGTFMIVKKEIIIDDRDGNVIGYKAI